MGGLYHLEAEIISQVRDKADLVEYARDHVEGLNQKGARVWGCCPFHEEKTGSFSIDTRKQLFHCFGCQVGGDVFDFYMRTRHVEFPEAVRQIAEREGILLPLSPAQTQRKKTEDVLRTAQEYFSAQLEKCGEVQDYLLQKRLLSEDTVKEWGLGFAPSNGLLRYLTEKRFSTEEIARSGLARKKTSWYDFFRERVTIPVYDHQDHLVGFIGRTIFPDAINQATPKYINSVEEYDGGKTPYRKGKVLLGLHKAMAVIKKKGAILTEGPVDIISAWQAGIRNVVAPSGTAFTEEQGRLLARYTSDVTLALDGDTAGIAGAKKAARVLFAVGITPEFKLLPSGRDLDDIVREGGSAAFTAVPKIDLIDFYRQTTDHNSPDKKLTLLTEIADSFRLEKSLTRKMMWIDETARRLEIDPAIVRERYTERLSAYRFSQERVEVSFPNSVESMALVYIANLLTVSPSYARQFFGKIPPTSVVFNDSLREVYELIISENKSTGPLQRYLPLVSRGKQGDFVAEAQRDAAFEYLKQKHKEGILRRVPFEIMRTLAVPLPKMLDESAKLLESIVAVETRERLTEELNEALRAGDPGKIASLISALTVPGQIA